MNMRMKHNDLRFPALVLFNEEVKFSKEGTFKMRSQYISSVINPYSTTLDEYQQKFSMNVYSGILYDYLVGPYVLPDHLTSATYHMFLEQVLRNLLEAVPLPI